MWLTDREVMTLRQTTQWFVHDSNRFGRAIHPRVADVVRRLEAAYELSATRHEIGCTTGDPTESKWIGSPTVAQILDWSERKVQRQASQLGGEKIGGRWLFPLTAVLQYREG